MKGRYELYRNTRKSLEKSLAYFQQAIQKDPDFAQAWAGLSDAYAFLGGNGLRPRQDSRLKQKEAALKAVELDDTLSDAHISLFDAGLGHEEIERAILLDPNNARAHLYHGRYLLIFVGRTNEAIAEVKHALQLDPLNPQLRNNAGVTLYYARRYDEAMEQFHQVPDPDVASRRRHRILAEIYDRKGMEKEAMAEYVTSLKFGGEEDLAASVQRRYVSAGYSEAKHDFLWGEIREGEKRAKAGTLPENAVWIAGDYAILGEKDKAFEWLDKAFQDENRGIHLINLDDRFAGVQSDPRFHDLLRRMGIPT